MTDPTPDEKRRLCETHGVDDYSELPGIVRRNAEADDTRLTDASYDHTDALGGLF